MFYYFKDQTVFDKSHIFTFSLENMFPITYTSHVQNIILEAFTNEMWEFTFAYLGPGNEALRSPEYIREASASFFGTVLFSAHSYLMLNFKHAS